MMQFFHPSAYFLVLAIVVCLAGISTANVIDLQNLNYTGTLCENVQHRVGQYCYTFHTTPLSWHGADQFCEKENGGLTSVEDQAEQDYLSLIMKTQFREMHKIWVGGIERSSGWRWVKNDSRFEALPLGCYEYKERNEDRFQYKSADLNSFTLRACIERCKFDSKRIAALLAGHKCYCANTYDSLAKTEDDICNVPCSGDESRRCGGMDSWYLYEVKHSYINWVKNKPTLELTEACAITDPVYNFQWRDIKCWHPYHFVCQLGSRLVKPNSSESNFFQARNYCLNLKGDLVQISNHEENEQMLAFVYKNKMRSSFWIGATNRQWTWSFTGKQILKTFWGAGQPWEESDTEVDIKCIELRKESNNANMYMWHEKKCTASRHYICKYDAFKSIPSPTHVIPSTTLPPSSQSTSSESNITQTHTPKLKLKETKVYDTPTDVGVWYLLIVLIIIVILLMCIICAIIVVCKKRRKKRTSYQEEEINNLRNQQRLYGNERNVAAGAAAGGAVAASTSVPRPPRDVNPRNSTVSPGRNVPMHGSPNSTFYFADPNNARQTGGYDTHKPRNDAPRDKLNEPYYSHPDPMYNSSLGYRNPSFNDEQMGGASGYTPYPGDPDPGAIAASSGVPMATSKSKDLDEELKEVEVVQWIPAETSPRHYSNAGTASSFSTADESYSPTLKYDTSAHNLYSPGAGSSKDFF